MKKYIALYAIAAAALITAPAIVHAKDNASPKPEAAQAGKHAKKHGKLPFHGKVASVDATAMTVTIGHTTVNVTSETKITKNGTPATFSEIAVGERISGSYTKDESGKKNASVIHIGGKDKKKKESKE